MLFEVFNFQAHFAHLFLLADLVLLLGFQIYFQILSHLVFLFVNVGQLVKLSLRFLKLSGQITDFAIQASPFLSEFVLQFYKPVIKIVDY